MIEFILLAAAIATASKVVSESYLFEGLRKRAARINVHLGEGISCQLCTGTWGGLIAAAFAPTFIHIDLPVAVWFADGLALAFAGRLLYSVQEVVLASSFWLERNNCPVEDEEPEYGHGHAPGQAGGPPVNVRPLTDVEKAQMGGIRQYIENGIFSDAKAGPKATPLTLAQIEGMLYYGTPKRVTEPVEEEAPQEQSLVETPWEVFTPPEEQPSPSDTDWEEDWKDLPDESEELA